MDIPLKKSYLKKILKFALKNNKGLIWCFARFSAIDFYKKYGFKVIGESFNYGNAGNSVKMSIKQ